MRLRLGTKFILLVALILSTTLGMSTYYSLRSHSKLLEEQLFEQNAMMGHFAALISAEAILAYDFVALNTYVNDLTNDRDVVFSVILDQEGQPMTSYIDKTNPYIERLANVSKGLQVADILGHYQQGTEDVHVVNFPINHRGEHLGVLVIGIGLERMQHELLRELLVQLSIYASIILILSLGIYWTFRIRVLNPVNQLVDGAKRVAQGNYDEPVQLTSRDELGELTESFNEMMREVQEDQRQLDYRAHYDSLTGLPNRVLAMHRINTEINRAMHTQEQFAVLFLDLNNFKTINDTMGHPVGDALLVEIGKRLASVLRDSDMVARLGGDEFLMLLTNVQEVMEVQLVTDRLIRVISTPIKINSRELYIQCSVGIAFYPSDGNSAERLMANADNAMYQAKLSKSWAVSFYAPEMNDMAQKRLALEQDLHVALEQGQLHLNFQPIIETASRRPLGAEVLARWQHPEKGQISPAEFIPIAEATGHIIKIGEWVIRSACRQMAKWKAMGIAPSFLTVNVSRIQFQSDLVSVVRRALRDFAIEPHELHLEITESVLMENRGHVPEILQQFDEDGLNLVLDDFGTGFSSLNYLKHFPFDMLKIDRSFVDGLPDDSGDVALVRGIIAMADSLSMTVVCEGVENEEQSRFLSAHGGHYLQGYLFGRPMDAEAFTRYLHEAGTANARGSMEAHSSGSVA